MTLSADSITIKNALAEIEVKDGTVNFIYSDLGGELLKEIRITKRSQTLNDLLKEISKQSTIRFTRNGNDVILRADTIVIAANNFVSLTGSVLQHDSDLSLGYANVILQSTTTKERKYSSVAGSDGRFAFRTIPKDEYSITATFVGYKSIPQQINLRRSAEVKVGMEIEAQQVSEINVTAVEQKGMTSSSKISREAIDLLQPSTFTDLLSLLPGGQISAPSLSTPNLIRLREASPPSGKEYAISSLGTLFVIDDIPISTDANRQELAQNSNLIYVGNKEFADFGMDMRGIPTDNIESVEIIRGIPSVRYGDLTSGVVRIDRRMTAVPFTARFKFDQFSKVFALSKGHHFAKSEWTVNADFDFLDGKRNPVDPLETFARYTVSLRAQKRWKTPSRNEFRWNVSLDYSGQFDDWANDPEQMMDEEQYKLDYNTGSFSSRLSLKRPTNLFQTVEWNSAARVSTDKVYRQRWSNNNLGGGIIPLSMEPGLQEAIMLPSDYLATGTVEGMPVNIYSTLRTVSKFDTYGIKHDIQAGLEWKMDKNLGNGQVFDLARPISNTFDYRPFPYHRVPAQHHASWFLEEQLKVPRLWGNQITAQLGLRGGSMLNLDPQYTLHGKWYTDPRINVQWQFPGIPVFSDPLVFTLTGGTGWLTKMPTMGLLQPDLMYKDFLSLAYNNINRPEYSRYLLTTYTEDLRNFDLSYARNQKKELRLDISWKKHELSVTVFDEITNSGFRTYTYPKVYTYRKYQNPTNFEVTAKPDPADLAYQDITLFSNVFHNTNGSQLTKKGVELTYITPRYNAIATRFTLTGAFFENNYQNSIALWFRGNSANNPVIGDFVVFNNYAALYPNWRDGYKRKRFSANFTADSYIKQLGLTVSLTSAFYFKGTNYNWDNNPGAPESYLTTDGVLHPYTQADREDLYLSRLVLQSINNGLTIDNRFQMHEHLRASKDFGRWLRLSLYLQNFLDINPPYTAINGARVRNSNPSSYFGMELRVKL